MKIVVLDGYTENPGDISWDSVAEFGDLVLFDRTPYEEDTIVSRIADAEIVITNKVPLTKNVFDKCPGIKYVAVIATGYNVVDVAYARKRGISVSNVPAYGTAAVGQAAIALLLEICNRVAYHSDRVHEGRWGKGPDWCFWDYPIIELAGKTMGIIGFGRIGQATARIAKAMGMKVLAYNRSQCEEGRLLADYVTLDELLENSDVIALHCPQTADTANIINRETISKMKHGVIIINNGRGGLIAEQDLADALNCGKVYAAGVDVVSVEPIKDDNPLLTAQNCYITPHISWAARESRQRIMDTTSENIRSFINGTPINVVN